MSYLTDTIRRGTFASRPATAPDGTVFLCTDGPVQFVRKGGAWQPYHGSTALAQPAAASNFTINQTSSNGTLTDDAGGLFFTALSRDVGEDVIFATQTNPGGTGAAYTLTVGFIPNPGSRNGTAGWFNYHLTGIGLYNSSTTQIKALRVYTTGTGEFRLQLISKTGLLGSSSASIDYGAYSFASASMVWFRVQDDGVTNRTWSVSNDGKHFKALTIEARTTGFSSQPDRIGIYMNAWNADATMTILSHQLTSP